MDFAPPVCKNMVYRYWAQLPSNGYEQSFAFAQLKGNSDKSPNWAPIIPSTKKYEVQLIIGQKTSNLFYSKAFWICCVHQPDWLKRRLLQSYMVSRYYSFYYIDLCISIFFLDPNQKRALSRSVQLEALLYIPINQIINL